MADDVMKRAADTPAAAPGATQSAAPTRRESRAERARKQVYRSRFMMIYVLLAAVCGVAIGSLIVLVQGGGPEPEVAWSSWEPTGSRERRAGQIGEHVGSIYRLPSGNELAPVVYSGPTTFSDQGVTYFVRALAVRPDTTGGRAEADDINTVNASRTVQYTLCGLGEACSIPEGEPSLEQGALLRREALELALYSFKYVDGTNSVVVLLPPAQPDSQSRTAFFFERSDVRAELGRPLRQTLTPASTLGLGEIGPDELRTLERLTRGRLYEYGYIEAGDGSLIMVLSPTVGA